MFVSVLQLFEEYIKIVKQRWAKSGAPREKDTRPRGYITFSMLNSTEHEILNARKYKNIEKFSFFMLRLA